MPDDPAARPEDIGHAKAALRDLEARIGDIFAEASAKLARPSKLGETARALQARRAKPWTDDAG